MAELWRPGEKIGQIYRLEKLIGRGGASEVWLARDLRLDRRVAIKVMTELGPRSEAVERFAREARVIAQLNHPSIVQIYDIGRENESRYIVMEFIDGSDLATLIGRGQIRIGWALRVAQQVANALEFAHEKGVLHRDIKPSNILVDASGQYAKLSDFGLARGSLAFGLRTITTEGTVMGTPAFMAPEQLAAREIGPSSDIYSLGATLYHLFTGQMPRGDKDLVALVREAAYAIPVSPKHLRPDIPQKLSAVILSMLEPDPSRRTSSLSELLSLLNELCSEIPFPEGNTLEERAIEQALPREKPRGVTEIAKQSGPSGFFDSAIFPKSRFFQDDSMRFSKIQETLQFYRDHLTGEYQSLLQQASLTYRLWLAAPAPQGSSFRKKQPRPLAPSGRPTRNYMPPWAFLCEAFSLIPTRQWCL